MYFHTPPNFQCHFFTTSTQHTDFIICSNLVSSPKSLNPENQNFPYIFSSSGVPYKVSELLLNTHIQTDAQTQTNAFLHLPSNSEYPPTPKIVQ